MLIASQLKRAVSPSILMNRISFLTTSYSEYYQFLIHLLPSCYSEKKSQSHLKYFHVTNIN
ncbi:hypothetical protein Avbf_17639 [Armadillidium vulgare]|nr:hypothetical protein Avbf_17639 [Armadillidium vulgare]